MASGVPNIFEVDGDFNLNYAESYDTKTHLFYRTFGLLIYEIPFEVRSSHLRTQLVHKFNIINQNLVGFYFVVSINSGLIYLKSPPTIALCDEFLSSTYAS
jgi:hypothetical protein